MTYNTFHTGYSKYSQCFGRMSHTYHCRNLICWKNQHKSFETFCGLAIQPIIHYLVLDWVELLYLFIRQTEAARFRGNSDENFKCLFQLLDNAENDKIEQNWKDLIYSNKGRKNAWLTLTNFPEPREVKSDTEKKLLGLVFRFIHQLNMSNANVVVRGNNLHRDYIRYDIFYVDQNFYFKS